VVHALLADPRGVDGRYQLLLGQVLTDEVMEGTRVGTVTEDVIATAWLNLDRSAQICERKQVLR